MNKTIIQIINKKMKDMELVPNSRRNFGAKQDDNDNSIRRSTLDLPQLKRKYSERTTQDDARSSTSDADNGGTPKDDISIEVVRPKDRNQDSDIVNQERTVIIKNGKLLGSQG
jgi:hypothetical protein